MSQTTVFISHNSKDKAFVRRLAKALEARNIKCWVDEAEIHFGESLVHKISGAINEIGLVIAVISNNSVFSNWVRQELDWAMTKEIKGNKIVVIPIIIDKCDIPFFLANKLYADFTEPNQFNHTLSKLVESVDYHMRGNPQASDQPNFGESVILKYNPTNIPLVVSIILVGISLCGIGATYAFSKTKIDSVNYKTLTHSIYIFFSFIIAAQLAELLRIALIRFQMHHDPVFAQDTGMIHVASLLFKNYRSFVGRHWSKLLTKMCVFIEIVVWLIILLLIDYAVKIASFL
jgi:hypothetical protein